MLKAELIECAKCLGFDAAGVARPQPLTWDHYASWIDKGYHGEMAYLARRLEERKDLSSILEGTKSVLVLAKRYKTIEPKQESTHHATISRYAWGEDYHHVMGENIRQLCDFIFQKTNGQHRAGYCVDSAPALERDYAAQAGIGWFGKQTNLINRSLGTWFFIGLVLTTLELEADRPENPHCGKCTRCLDVCPTGALIGPYTLDARRCISYLTIELKGAIPRELRSPIGKRIFGCDDCLEVCPWNRFAKASDEKRFFPLPGLNSVDLIEILSLTPAEFNQRFMNSPIKRTKRRGLLRNAAVALGNTRDPRAVPALIRALADTEPLIRAHAAWALGQIGTNEAHHGLIESLPREKDTNVQEEINIALNS